MKEPSHQPQNEYSYIRFMLTSYSQNQLLLGSLGIVFISFTEIAVLVHMINHDLQNAFQKPTHNGLPAVYIERTCNGRHQGATKRCRLSLLTNSAFVIRVQRRREGGVAGSQPMSTAVHITWHGAQINFGDLPPYLIFGRHPKLCALPTAEAQCAFSSQQAKNRNTCL